ncbi:MAG TPA: DivIVA domain-containing protein [bacterium]|nr:DivIVA domain-containing protein [bacterium]
MALVPLEIKKKEFRKTMLGYDSKEVEDFLEEVSEELGRVLSKNAAMEAEVEAAKDNLAKYHDLEDTIKETLLLAQKTRDEILESAKKQAELIVEEAHRQGRKIEERYAQVKSAKRQFQIEFETLLESFRARVNEMKFESEGYSATDAD